MATASGASLTVTAAPGAAGAVTMAGSASLPATATLTAAGDVPAGGHISYRDDSVAAGTGSSATVTLPASWAAGDLAVVALTVHATGQAPACTGWTTRYGDGNGYTWATATRSLEAGDSNPVFTWSQSADWDAACCALTPDVSYSLSVTSHPADTSAGPGSQVTPPPATAAAGDASVLLVTGRAASAVAVSSYSLTPPSGWTLAAAQEGSSTEGGPGTPSAPYNVTSLTKDGGAVVSFRPPTSQGGGAVTHFIVTPRIAGVEQSQTTVTEAAAGSITGSDSNTYRKVTVTGLTNSTAYTFTVQARNAYGDSLHSSPSAENTPYAGLLLGDDFNGAAGGPIDPEWWLLDVAATSDEDDAYRPTHVRLDGSGHLELKTTHDTYLGKPYTSGAIQNNTLSFLPTAGNWLTWETRAQVCSDEAGGMWPCPWTSGTYYQQQYKTDQTMDGWDSTTKAETDICEFNQNSNQYFQCNTWATSSPESYTHNAGVNLSLAQHVYRCDWKPSTGTTFYLDGSQIHSQTAAKQTTAQFLMWFHEVKAGYTPSTPQYSYIDYIRIYDRSLLWRSPRARSQRPRRGPGRGRARRPLRRSPRSRGRCWSPWSPATGWAAAPRSAGRCPTRWTGRPAGCCCAGRTRRPAGLSVALPRCGARTRPPRR